MIIRSKLDADSSRTTPWSALEEVARRAIDSMAGAGGHTRTVTATVRRADAPGAARWLVSIEIETVIP